MNPFDLPGPQFLLFYTILAGIVLGVWCSGAGVLSCRQRRRESIFPIRT